MEALLIGDKIFVYAPFVTEENSNEPIAAVEVSKTATVEEPGKVLLACNFLRPRKGQNYILHVHELDLFSVQPEALFKLIYQIVQLYSPLTPLVIYEGLRKIGRYKPFKGSNCRQYGRLILKPRGSKQVYKSKFEVE
jgi:hypothetical protein